MASERNGRKGAHPRGDAAADSQQQTERGDVTTHSFEAALERLDQIVSQLEDGQIPLDTALALYEQGVRLAQECQRLLDDADLRLERLRVLDDAPGDTASSRGFIVEAFEIDEG